MATRSDTLPNRCVDPSARIATVHPVLIAQASPSAASNSDIRSALIGGVVAAVLTSVVTTITSWRQRKHDRSLRTEELAQDRKLRTMELDHDRLMRREERTYDRVADTYVELARYHGEVTRYLDGLRFGVLTGAARPPAPAESLDSEWFSTTVARVTAYATEEVRRRLANFVNQTHQATETVTLVDNAAEAARADPLSVGDEFSTVMGMMKSAFDRARIAGDDLAAAINGELRVDLDRPELPAMQRWS